MGKIKNNGYKPSILMKIALMNIGLWILTYTIFNGYVTLFHSNILEGFNKNTLPSYLHFYIDNGLYFLKQGRLFFILMFIIGVVKLIGCSFMLFGKRRGFLYYTIGLISGLILPIFFFEKRGISIGDIMLGLLVMVFFFIQINRNIRKEAIEIDESEDIEKVNKED